MNRRSLKIIIFLGVLAVLVVAILGLGRNKYYVKRFIKSHKILYVPAKKLAEVKYKVTKSFASSAPKKDLHLNKKEWALVFDASKSRGRFHRFWGNLGYESLKSGILSGNNRRLLELMKETNTRTKGTFRYIRAHNLFSNGKPPWGEGCDIYHEDSAGRPSYNWSIVDQVFDRIVQNGFKPIVELSFMPDALASLPDRRQKWGKANISPPKDYNKWQALVYQTVSHLRKRYGDEEIKTWYFEVWNEPDLGYLFWVEDSDPRKKPYGDMEEYFRLYDYAVQGAKQAFPDIHIGGPASAGGQISQLLEHVALGRNDVTGDPKTPIDFISSHAYGKIGNAFSKKSDGSVVGKILWKINRAAHHDHPEVRKLTQQLPFLLTETGPSTRNGTYYNTRYVAAWLAKMVDAVFFLGERYGKPYQPREVVFWSSEQLARRFGKEKGIATYFRLGDTVGLIKRPAYNAFELLGHLGNERIEQINPNQFGDPVHAVATRDGENSVEILIYHLNDDDKTNALRDTFRIDLEIKNLPFEEFAVQWFMIDETHSNSYTVWRKLGDPKKLNTSQFRELSEKDDLTLYKPVWEQKTQDQSFHYSFDLQNNSVSLIVLSALRSEHKLSMRSEAF
ncbi:MAG: hypothetical protein ACE5HO_03880 [bacterium]